MKPFKHFLIPGLLLAALPAAAQGVTAEVERQSIPTYEIGAPEADPIFFTGRVYQGAEGYIYPYPLYDVLTDRKIDKDYDILRLRNEWVDIGVLPEIGGRIFQATDRTNGYHFFYTQTGVKPALIGMLGAWLSGGVEWNIPDHHRASTYMPVNWTLKENPDGSRTAWVGETELRHRLKWSVGTTVHPGRSWVEARVKVINPTPMIQSMLYWANVSVHCGDDYQVVFPPDVEVGVDHHKVYFTPWPEGPVMPGSDRDIDLSMWKNFTEGSRSIFAWDSKMSFLAGYDHGRDVGTVHVANRHQVPGKKFFLWGNNPNGHMWNKILSDNDGHYLELMVGAFSDNQPDYSWLAPGEIREFSQIWFPVKGIKGVKNATVDGAVNFEPSGTPGRYRVGYCATSARKDARVVVRHKDAVLMDKRIDIDPDRFFLEEVEVPDVPAWELYTALLDADGNILVDYTPVRLKGNDSLPPVIDGTKPVKEYDTNEELYLAGLRVDQFNNARLRYMDFYEEALARDSMDARVNIEVGKHYIRTGELNRAERHLLRAQARLAHDYTRVLNTEANYYLGYLYSLLGRDMEAEENLWAATWTPAFKHPAYYQLALAKAKKGRFDEALAMVDESLVTGARDLQALTLKAFIQRRLGQDDAARATLASIRAIDPIDYMSGFETAMLDGADIAAMMRAEAPQRSTGIMAVQEMLEVAANYLNFGDRASALALLDGAVAAGEPYRSSPLVQLYRAYSLLPDTTAAREAMALADRLPLQQSFPHRIEEVPIFENLAALDPDNARLDYLFGNLLYYLGQKDRGLALWRRAADADSSNAMAARNVGFGEGVNGNLDRAIAYYDRAIKANPDDPLLFTESDKIREQAGIAPAERLKILERHKSTVTRHDDAVRRLLSLYNETGSYDKAIAIMDGRHFHLWEGGGEIHETYVDSHILQGMEHLRRGRNAKAVAEFEAAKLYPANLEVAPPSSGGSYDAQASFLTAVAHSRMGSHAEADEAYRRAAAAHAGSGSDQQYYRILALRALGDNAGADAALAGFRKAVEGMKQRVVDNYAKFGDGNRAAMDSRVSYFEALLHRLDGRDAEAGAALDRAIALYPGNIRARSLKNFSI